MSITDPIFHDEMMVVQGIFFESISTLSAFHATESNRMYPHNGPCRPSIYGSEVATKEALWRTLVANTNRSGQPVPTEYKNVLLPQIWDIGIGPDLQGLKGFYHRNKPLWIFNRSLEQWICGPKKTLAQNVRHQLETMDHLLRATAIQREATLRATRVLAWRRLVTTDAGYLGIVPAGAEAGDMIAMLGGCGVPLVLRPRGEDRPRFSIIGECYVHDVMSGEVLGFLEQGKCKMVDITIC